MNRRRTPLPLRGIVVTLTLVLLCHDVCRAAGTLEVIRERFVKKGEQLPPLSGHWRETVEVLNTPSWTVTETECRFAINGGKEFWDLKKTWVAGPPLNPDWKHSAMSYDGNETRILLLPKYGRIFPGDERKQYGAPDNFLGRQGFPREGGWELGLFIPGEEGRRVLFGVAKLLQNSAYQLEEANKVNGVVCVAAVSPTDRLYFDPERGYALIQRDVLSSRGEILWRYTFHEHAEILPDLWLAHRIVTEMHRGGELKTRSTLNVVDLEIDNVPDELFLYKFEPEVKISDSRHFAPNEEGGTLTVGYRVPADPAEFETVVAKAVETQKRFNLADAQETGTIRWLLLGSNVLVGMIIVAVVLHLRRRRVTK